jgi:hypothetical protein
MFRKKGRCLSYYGSGVWFCYYIPHSAGRSLVWWLCVMNTAKLTSILTRKYVVSFHTLQVTKALWESRGIALHYFLSGHWKALNGQRHAPAAPYPRDRPGTHCTGGWVGLRAALDMCGNSSPHLDSIPGASRRRQSLYQLFYPAHKNIWIVTVIPYRNF